MTDQAHRPTMIGHRPWCDTADHDDMPCTSPAVAAVPDWDDGLPAASWLIDRPEAPVLFVDLGGRGLYLEPEDARTLAAFLDRATLTQVRHLGEALAALARSVCGPSETDGSVPVRPFSPPSNDGHAHARDE